MKIEEVFKPISNYPDYQVSNRGRIKSFKRGKGSILKHGITKHGYFIVRLRFNGMSHTKKVHQLVAMEFLDHTPCGFNLVVNHIDFNKQNNNVENLEIVTSRENSNKKHLKSTLKYLGVTWHKINKKWQASIYMNGKLKHLGYFNSEVEASNAYQSQLLNIK